jgi:hypothetical protein
VRQSLRPVYDESQALHIGHPLFLRFLPLSILLSIFKVLGYPANERAQNDESKQDLASPV